MIICFFAHSAFKLYMIIIYYLQFLYRFPAFFGIPDMFHFIKIVIGYCHIKNFYPKKIHSLVFVSFYPLAAKPKRAVPVLEDPSILQFCEQISLLFSIFGVLLLVVHQICLKMHFKYVISENKL